MTVRSEAELRQRYDPPLPLIVRKTLTHLDRHCVEFIARSPFVCIGSSGADGGCDVSPRGDPPGFVRVVDQSTLLIPDRKGNNRLDTMGNLLERGGVGLLFLIPGIEETLRVNGQAEIVAEPELLEPMAVAGRPPKSALRVAVEEAFIHCGRALKRSRLWDPELHAERSEVPTIGQWLRDQVDPDAEEQAIIDEAVALEAKAPADRSNLY